uniref:Uncharacterized protein n=1 Tax=Moniliophthora roreri TaxID=221103 RepID=A0A0W0GDD3_MONRR
MLKEHLSGSKRNLPHHYTIFALGTQSRPS